VSLVDYRVWDIHDGTQKMKYTALPGQHPRVSESGHGHAAGFIVQQPPEIEVCSG